MSKGSSVVPNHDGDEDDRASFLSSAATNSFGRARSSSSFLLPPSSLFLWLSIGHGLPLSGGRGEVRVLGLRGWPFIGGGRRGEIEGHV